MYVEYTRFSINDYLLTLTPPLPKKKNPLKSCRLESNLKCFRLLRQLNEYRESCIVKAVLPIPLPDC